MKCVGLYWFMGQLNQWKVQGGQVFVVKLPEWEVDKKGNIIRKNSWGEVAPEKWHQYIGLTKACVASIYAKAVHLIGKSFK